MELLYRYAGLNRREIGELMEVDYSSVSVARTRLRDMLTTDERLQKHFRAIGVP
jgi:DNA-directed RNA polymerase specialized sigma24 family protein